MSDVTQGEDSKRKAIAERLWVGPDGAPVDDEEKATGFTYKWRESGRSFTMQFDSDGAGTETTMLAIFGGLTKAGNIANTWKNLPDHERGSDPIDDISAWFKVLSEGQWGEERAGGVGARFDKEKLAEAIGLATSATPEQVAGVRAKLEANAKVKDGKREILYGTWAMRNPKVKEHYDRLVPPSNAPTAEALLG